MKPKVRYEVTVTNIKCTYADKGERYIDCRIFYFTHEGILILTHRAGEDMPHRAKRVMQAKVHKGVMSQLMMLGLAPFKFCSYRLESVRPISSIGRLT
jgi:hypothetical protein